MKNKFSLILTLLLLFVNLLWWLTDIKDQSAIDGDNSMLGLAFVNLLIIFVAVVYLPVKGVISILKKQYDWLYTYFIVDVVLVILFLTKWVPEK